MLSIVLVLLNYFEPAIAYFLVQVAATATPVPFGKSAKSGAAEQPVEVADHSSLQILNRNVGKIRHLIHVL